MKVDATVCRTSDPGEDLRSFTHCPVYPDPEPCNELHRRRPSQEVYHRLRHGREAKGLARKTLACTQTDEIVEFCRQFRPFKVVVEATASYLWFVELVEPLAEKVVLANPKKLRVIAESTKKTDRLDAQVLTEFLVLDMIPESYQPTPRQRQHRALVRHRQYLQGRITSVRSKIRTHPYSRFGPATADRGSRGIRDQPRNPPKCTEKRIRINFPFLCPSVFSVITCL